MAETPKQLFQVNCNGIGTPITAYTAIATTIVSSIVICNNTGAPTTFRVSLVPKINSTDWESVTPKNYIYWNTVLPADNTFVANLGIVIPLNMQIRVSSSVNVSVYASGIEVTA